MPLAPLGQDEKQLVYDWLNKLDVPKPTSFIHRDFSDACLLAKLVKLYLPNLVELHNYQTAVGASKKLENWQLIQAKILKKVDIKLTEKEMQDLANSKPGVIESLLHQIRSRFDDLTNKDQQMKESNTIASQIPQQITKSPQKPKKEVEHDIYEQLKDVKSTVKRTNITQFNEECQLCKEKDSKIDDYIQEVKLLEEKIEKLQQLVRLKDGKNKAMQQQIDSYQVKLKQFGVE